MKFFIYKFSLILSESIHFPWQYCSKIILSDLLCTLLFRSVTQPLNDMCHVINNKNRRHVTYEYRYKNYLRSSSRLCCPLGFGNEGNAGLIRFSFVFVFEGNIGWLNIGFPNFLLSNANGNRIWGLRKDCWWLIFESRNGLRWLSEPNVDPKVAGDGEFWPWALNPSSPITADSGTDSLSVFIGRSSKSWNTTNGVKRACKKKDE